MNLTAWIIFGMIVSLIIFVNTLLKDKKTKGKNKKEEQEVAPKFETKDPWQKRNLFNGFLYFVGLPAIWFVGVVLVFYAIVNGF